MAKVDAEHVWRVNYGMLMSVLARVASEIGTLGLDVKELFLLAAVEEHKHPAALATALLMPKPTVTVMVKRLEAAGFVRREIDASDLRRHRLLLTPAGKRAATRGMSLLVGAFEERLRRLSAAEQSQLATALERMS